MIWLVLVIWFVGLYPAAYIFGRRKDWFTDGDGFYSEGLVSISVAFWPIVVASLILISPLIRLFNKGVEDSKEEKS